MDVPVGVCNSCRAQARSHHSHLLLQLPGNTYNHDQCFICLNCGIVRWLCEEGKSDYGDYEKKICVMEEVRRSSSKYIPITPYFIGE